ncbi:unnamed protein product [Clonostachys byssicola]|uniref:Uncharacterized protein n=1 Tax=Clonostachys byssicola TaxID=160290 RepID=A0A9N9TW62_9HYPO|nr:unnamed protein product [Clonostachys byssicola]
MTDSEITTSKTGDAESIAPESTLSLKRWPTDSSYYDLDQTPCDGKQGQVWIYAREVREQQKGICLSNTRPDVRRATKGVPRPKYPSPFWNKENLLLRTKSKLIYNPKERRKTPGWFHHPLIPGRTETFKGECKPGLIRSIFNPRDPSKFDVVVHVKTKESNNGFKKAIYHPAVKQVDKIGVVAENSNEN